MPCLFDTAKARHRVELPMELAFNRKLSTCITRCTVIHSYGISKTLSSFIASPLRDNAAFRYKCHFITSVFNE